MIIDFTHIFYIFFIILVYDMIYLYKLKMKTNDTIMHSLNLMISFYLFMLVSSIYFFKDRL